METEDTDRGKVKTVETAFDLLETLRRKEGARVSQLADEFEMAKSTIHRHLNTLADRGYVVKEGNTYFVSLGFLHLGEYARMRKPAYRMAKPKVRELAEKTGEQAQFVVEEQGKAFYLYRESGDQAVAMKSGIGESLPLHATAAGKAILAHLPGRRVDEIIETRGLPEQTPHTITDADELFRELETIRDRGYSLNQEEEMIGLHAVCAPVTDENEQIIGALSVSGPAHRLGGTLLKEELPSFLLGTANELELNIAHS